MNKSEILKKKILYRSSYRGTKEMDILLSSFVKYYIDKDSVGKRDERGTVLDAKYSPKSIWNHF